jgi:DNA-binding MarR family transcriptional regulator
MSPDRVDRIVAEWGEARPSMNMLGFQITARILHVAKLLEREMEARFAEFGVTRAEFDVLAALLRSGEPYSLAPTNLSKMLLLSTSAMTNRIDRLELAGYVTREPDPHDRRGIRVALTPEGLVLVERVLEAHLENEHRLVSALGSREQATLARLLRTLSNDLEGDQVPDAKPRPSAASDRPPSAKPRRPRAKTSRS